MLQSTVFRLRRALRIEVRIARCLQSRPGGYLVLSLLLFGGLGGCKFDEDNMAAYKQSKAYRAIHPVDIDTLPTIGPRLTDQPNEVTGKIAPRAAPLSGVALPTPAPLDSEFVLDDLTKSLSEGERLGSWRGMADIYWKLNWMRSELLSANVPRNLHEFIIRTRKHVERIAREDPAHPDSDNSEAHSQGEMVQCIDAATKALKHIEAGWDHFQQSNTLETASIHWRSIPWGTGEEQVKNYFENQGLSTSERELSHSASVNHANDDEGGSIGVRRTSAALLVSPQQKQAVDLALRYERVYHASPDSVARQEFSEGMRETLRLGELFKYTYRPPSVPGTMTTIVTPLHQEPSSVEPSKPPDSSTGATLPTTSKSDASDPFHASGPIIP